MYIFILFFFSLKEEEEQQKKNEEKDRRDYIKNEYLRRKQLKLMDDMDEVIKPRSGSLKKKPRPKSIHRDVADLSTPRVGTAGQQHPNYTHQDVLSRPLIPDLTLCFCHVAGARPRGFSVSSVSLASLNLADNSRDQPDNRKNNR